MRFFSLKSIDLIGFERIKEDQFGYIAGGVLV
jgi:hypothetical protein